jgi:hypothetical protein
MSGMGTAVAPFPLDQVVEREGRRGIAALASVIAAAGGVACALSVAAPALHGLPLHPLDQAIHTAVAAAWIGTGVVALLRRPGNATGLLMAAVGFLWLVGDLYWIIARLNLMSLDMRVERQPVRYRRASSRRVIRIRVVRRF